MIVNRVLIVAAMMASIASSVWAAPAEMVGTYSGTVKTTAFNGSSKTVTKETIQIEIAADDSTTVTLNGAPKLVQIATYNTKDAIIFYGDSGSTGIALLASLNLKGTTLKGTATGLQAASSVFTGALEAKYKLKKQ